MSTNKYSWPLVECFNYTVLNDANRGQTYAISNSLCDNAETFPEGWYRFSGQAGNQMPESCVPTRRCATFIPGWLNGCHPSVSDGVVRRQACFNLVTDEINNCCFWSQDLFVRNCGEFYVYRLSPTPGCYYRYCGNGLAVPGRKMG